jgi:hypothetical protein
MRREPVELKRIARLAQVADDVLEIRLAKVREHPAVMDIRAPADEAVLVGLLPEFGDQAAQQQMLGEAHARMRRHLKGAHLDQPEPASTAFRRKQFIDRKFRAMRVAAGIDEQVAE